MSNATLAVYGRLGSDPREHETRKGGAMATASLAATLDCRVQGEPEPEDGTLWLNVVAFGRVAEDLCRCSKGDPVSVSGRLQLSRYVTRDGEERESLACIADSVVSARTVRPRGGRRKGDGDGRDRDDGRRHGDDAGGRMWPAAGAGEGGGYREASQPAARPGGPPADFDDDIPF